MAKENKCINCGEYRDCKDSYASWIFFIIGLIATISIRAVIVLIHLDPVYGKAAWYMGVGGFFLFFIYKFKVSQTRSKLITQKGLVDKISNQKQLAKEDYSAISAILCALSSRKERVNYIFIFGLSAVALTLAAYFDFIK